MDTMAAKVPCELVSWGRFASLARRLAFKILDDDYVPDLIVAIGRGGYLPARLLSDCLHVLDLADFKIEHYRGTRKYGQARVKYPLTAEVSNRRVLLVDDVSDSGDTFETAMDHIQTRGTPAQLRTAVLDHKTVSTFVPDYYARKVIKWRWIVYPWAVTEDVTGFIEAMDPPPQDSESLAERIHRDHGIRLSRPRLEEILAFRAAKERGTNPR